MKETIKNPKFQIYRGKNQQYYFRYLRRDGDILLASEGYATKTACEQGIAAVKENAPDDDLYECSTASDGKYYFVLKTSNHEFLGNSQMYTWEAAMENSIRSIIRNAPNAPVEDTIKNDY